MAYTIELTRPAARWLRKLDQAIRRRIAARIDSLADDPRPPGCLQLQGSDDPPLYRVRVGDYRIIYCIEDDKLIVLVVRIGHRSDVYD